LGYDRILIVLKGFWPKREEKFLVVEVFPHGARGVLLCLDEERRLTARKVWPQVNSLVDFFKKWQPQLATWQVIVSVAPGLSAAVTLPRVFTRNHVGQPLAPEELENFLGKVVSQSFNEVRAEASRELQVREMDTVLVESSVKSFQVDGHTIVDPIGFRAKSVAAELELTFVPRALYESLRVFSDRQHTFFFTDSLRAKQAWLVRAMPSPTAAAIVGRDRLLLVGSKRDKKSGYSTIKRALPWSACTLTDAVGAAWGVSTPMAEKIYHAYLAGEYSPPVRLKLTEILEPTVSSFFREIEKSHPGKNIFLASETPLPFTMPFSRQGMRFIDLPLESLLNQVGVEVSLKNLGLGKAQIFQALAPFVEFYYDKSDKQINHWLRRRLHWLGAVTTA